MASFRVHIDAENNPNLMRAKPKEMLVNNQRRQALSVVNSNADFKNIKNAGPLEKGQIKPKLTKCNTLAEKGKVIQPNNVVPSKSKAFCQPFPIFEDPPQRKPAAALKNENKVRVLKEKKFDLPAPVGTSTDFLPRLPQCPLPVPKNLEPEPMSPAELLDSPMCMDISLKSECKISKECEAAVKELEYLNLTERLFICDEYRKDISQYLRALQYDHRPRKNYMSRQPDITYNMRAVLVDWLVEVGEEYKMTNETLYLAVSYIDRFLSCMSVIRSKLQLVGTAAMFIAAKYEEIYPPDVKDFVYITDDTYTIKQVLRMEHLILRILQFKLSVPTAQNFLSDYTSHFPTPDNVKYLAMYLCELTLLQGDPYLEYLPSNIAAGALCVARASLLPDDDVMPAALQEVLDVELADIMHVIVALEATYRAAESNVQQATREKYKTDKYLRVASFPPPDTDCSSLLTKESTPTPEHPAASRC